jgi:hypothetical protein
VNGHMAIVIFILMFSIHSRRRQYFSRQIINKEFASRWYPGAGLYRNVSLIIKKQRKYRPMGTVYNHLLSVQQLLK